MADETAQFLLGFLAKTKTDSRRRDKSGSILRGEYSGITVGGGMV